MKKKKKIRLILIIIFSFLLIISTKNKIENKNENKKTDKIVKEEIKKIKKDNNQEYLDESIKKDNIYTIGWLRVEGTNIDYPVVQYKDNEYYLSHDFNNNYNSAGWIFMDYHNKLNDQNIVIYGHHRRDGSMFGSIDNLFKDNKSKNIYFITEEGTTIYRIFSVYSINSEDYYINNNFNNFKETINTFKNRSQIDFNENTNNIEQIITLSSCHSNNIERLVVHGYKKE